MITLFTLLLSCTPTLLPQEANDPSLSAVKIFSTRRGPEIDRPWTKEAPQEGTGSGVILDGGFLLTNAHVVSYAQRVEVQPNGSGKRHEVEVAFISTRDDLALLRPIEEDFFDTYPSVPLAAALPKLGQELTVLGFPTGGEEASTTAGVVSRIEYRRADGFEGLSIQVDAPINPGNSGGPALIGGEVAGLSFLKRTGSDADSIGYVIPAETVQRFLDDISDGSYEGTPRLLVTWSKAENPAFRDLLALPSEQTGVILHPSALWVPENFSVKKRDVLLSIGGKTVDNFGRIDIAPGVKVEWTYQVQLTALNGSIPLELWRDGAAISIEAEVVTQLPLLLRNLKGEYPSYYVYGPVTFIEVSDVLMNGVSPSLLFLAASRGSTLLSDIKRPQDTPEERIVVATFSLLSHQITKGYEYPMLFPVLNAVNGVKVKNLRDLVRTLEGQAEEFTLFEFDGRNVHDLQNSTRTGPQDLVFRHKEVLRTREDILEEAGIRSYYSKDMRDLIKED
jgi:S1-C subfamily serine protease